MRRPFPGAWIEMPNSVMTLFPYALNLLETLKIPLQTSLSCSEILQRSISTGIDCWQNNRNLFYSLTRHFSQLSAPWNARSFQAFLNLSQSGTQSLVAGLKKSALVRVDRFRQERFGELEFLKLFTDTPALQDWSVDHDKDRVLLNLPSLKVIDISSDSRHRIQNDTVIFAPRAGHHSNIAERVALFLRDNGLTRMVVVEQKCAEEIPLYVNGRRHREDFAGQVAQYTTILKYLKKRTGRPPHLIAICQPGPLLMATLILNPGLGKTFGSAGSPMHTEAEEGILTDFARTVGESYIDRLLTLFGLRIDDNHPGAGRTVYDGRLQVLGFYLVGFDLHFRNLKNLLTDLKTGNRRGAERQKAFYHWYNSVQHFPAGFIRDTFKKIFIRNDLVRGTLAIGNRRVGIADYPAAVPVWALGGLQDTIAPPLQATGHMALITSVPSAHKLNLLCDGGHMGLFRSRKILEKYYAQIAAFLLAHSDRHRKGPRRNTERRPD
jgi:polyhydroxyalkanoate depolymerase